MIIKRNLKCQIILQDDGMIEAEMQINHSAVIGSKSVEIRFLEGRVSEIHHQMRLLRGWDASPHLLLLYQPHLEKIMGTEPMTEYMGRDRFPDLINYSMNVSLRTREFFPYASFDGSDIDGHTKRIKKSPGRVTRGVVIRIYEKLPGHKSEQVHH